MALIFCTKCGHKVSTTAPKCPGCGAPPYVASSPTIESIPTPAEILPPIIPLPQNRSEIQVAEGDPNREQFPPEELRRVSFATYLLALFVPPLYFATRRKWWAFVVNSFFYCVSLGFLLTIVFAIVAPLFWILCVAHAFFDLSFTMRDLAIQKQAEVLATALEMRERRRN
jgi:hypothetical protein